MTEAIAAVRDALTMIPVVVRRVIYGALGVIVLADAVFHVLSDTWGDALTLAFGLFAPVLAIANSTTPKPAAPLPPPLGGAVPENFDGEFA